jgi:lipoprotein signal peptidase
MGNGKKLVLRMGDIKGFPIELGLAMVFAGGVGNLYDRIACDSAVVDF